MESKPQIDWSRAAPLDLLPEWAQGLSQYLGYSVGTPLTWHVLPHGEWVKKSWSTGDVSEIGAFQIVIVGIPIVGLPGNLEAQPDEFAYSYRHPENGEWCWDRRMVTRVMVPKTEVFVEHTYRANGTIRTIRVE